MTVRPATDEEVYSVLFDSRILYCISDDPDLTPEEFDLPRDCHYLTTSGEDIFIIHPNGLCHANVLPGLKCKVERAKATILHAFNNLGYEELSAEVPLQYANVCRFTLECGFSLVYQDQENYYLRIKKDGFCT